MLKDRREEKNLNPPFLRIISFGYFLQWKKQKESREENLRENMYV